MTNRTARKTTSKSSPSCSYPVIWDRIGERMAAQSASPITVERIVRAAIGLADREGFEKISMRRIAAELGSGVMSLYHYVPCKSDLLDLMLDEAIGETILPDKPSGDWRADLHVIAERTRLCLKGHPWLAGLINSRPALGPKRFAVWECSLAAVAGLGLDIRTMQRMVTFVFTYVTGFVATEMSEAQALRREARNESLPLPSYIERLFAAGELPHVECLFRETGAPPPEDKCFENGLKLVLDGMAAALGDHSALVSD